MLGRDGRPRRTGRSGPGRYLALVPALEPLPLSDALSGRSSLLLGSAAAAARASVLAARRFREQERLAALARRRLWSLYRDPQSILELPIVYDEDESRREEGRRVRALFEGLDVKTDQVGLERALEQEDDFLVCYGERSQRFELETCRPLRLLLLGSASADFVLGDSARVQFHDSSRGSVLARREDGEAGFVGVVAGEQARVVVSSPSTISCRGRAVVFPRHPAIHVVLGRGGTCELGMADAVSTSGDSRVVLREEGHCRSIEIDDYIREGEAPTRVLDPLGAVLVQSGTSLVDHELRGIRIVRCLPF